MAQVTVYTKTYCPYCDRAKALLKLRGIGFTEISVEQMSDDERAALFKRSGMRTVPQIFNGESLIGGYTELAEQDQRDQLNSVLKG